MSEIGGDTGRTGSYGNYAASINRKNSYPLFPGMRIAKGTHQGTIRQGFRNAYMLGTVPPLK